MLDNFKVSNFEYVLTSCVNVEHPYFCRCWYIFSDYYLFHLQPALTKHYTVSIVNQNFSST